MIKHSLFFLVAVIVSFACGLAEAKTHLENDALEHKQVAVEFVEATRQADGIRHAVWVLDNGTDLIAKNLDKCRDEHSDTLGISKCLDTAIDSYKKVLDALQKHQDKQENCGGTICGILSRYNEIAKMREQIAERSVYLGGGQE